MAIIISIKLEKKTQQKAIKNNFRRKFLDHKAVSFYFIILLSQCEIWLNKL